MKQNTKGGGIFSKKEEFIKLLKRAKSSESNYISTYSKHVKAAIKHANAAEKHSSNLKALDNIMPDGFDSFLQIFNKTISPEIRIKKKTDTSSPLLLRNYNIDSIADKDDLARDHLWHQCHYVLKTKFAPQDAVLVTKLNIADHNKSTFTMAITGVTFGKDSKRTISHTNYNANLAEIRTNLTDIIASIKKDVMEQVVQENVFAAPINNVTLSPGTPGTPGLFGPVSPAVLALKNRPVKPDPIPDIYGVKALLNTPQITASKPLFGDNKPEYGEKKPEFGEKKSEEKKPEFGNKPSYLDQTPILIDKPPRPPSIAEEAPIEAPDGDFMQRHQPKGEFGDFGKSQKFKPPREFKPRGDRGSNDRGFKPRDKQSRRYSQKRNSSPKRGSNKRGSQGKHKFKPRGSDRRPSNRFNKRHHGSKRKSRGTGPKRTGPKRSGSMKRGPPPPPDFNL